MVERLIETQKTVVVYCMTDDGWRVAGNMIEEMKIVAMDQHNKLGEGSLLFQVSTTEDFTDCDVLGTSV